MNHGLRHLSMRNRKKVRSWFDYFMYGIAMATPLVLLPQVFKLFSDKNVVGLSIDTWFLLGCLNMFWIVYGLVHREPPIYIGNFLVGILNFIIVYGIILYR